MADLPAEDHTGDEVEQAEVQETPARETWAEAEVEDEEAQEEDEESDGGEVETQEQDAVGREGEGAVDPWARERVDAAAAKGFDFRKRGDRWTLKISMGSLGKNFTDRGMEHYCAWLEERLSSLRQEHGEDNPEELFASCGGDVDFSGNGLSNESVGLLLKLLARFKVQVALLKLHKNRISAEGVAAICEFVEGNDAAGPVHEMHLTHNKIDDSAVLQLLRTLEKLRPRYPAARGEGAEEEPVRVPTWVRLGRNAVEDAAKVLETAAGEGIAVCVAYDRSVCSTTKCKLEECPLVHLYAFEPDPEGGKGSRKGAGKGKRHQADRENGGKSGGKGRSSDGGRDGKGRYSGGASSSRGGRQARDGGGGWSSNSWSRSGGDAAWSGYADTSWSGQSSNWDSRGGDWQRSSGWANEGGSGGWSGGGDRSDGWRNDWHDAGRGGKGGAAGDRGKGPGKSGTGGFTGLPAPPKPVKPERKVPAWNTGDSTWLFK